MKVWADFPKWRVNKGVWQFVVSNVAFSFLHSSHVSCWGQVRLLAGSSLLPLSCLFLNRQNGILSGFICVVSDGTCFKTFPVLFHVDASIADEEMSFANNIDTTLYHQCAIWTYWCCPFTFSRKTVLFLNLMWNTDSNNHVWTLHVSSVFWSWCLKAELTCGFTFASEIVGKVCKSNKLLSWSPPSTVPSAVDGWRPADRCTGYVSTFALYNRNSSIFLELFNFFHCRGRI